MAPVVIYIYLPIFRNLNVTTAYEYLEKWFHVSILLLGSFSFIAFQLGRMGVVILVPALALLVVTGLKVYLCIVLFAVFSTLYTTLGDMEAVRWTDVLQSAVLLGGALTALATLTGVLDGRWKEFVTV